MPGNNLQQPSVEGFIPRQAFEKTLGEIDKHTKTVNDENPAKDLKAAYNQLLYLREIAYPLLLLDGPPYPLTTEPINVRLLPPIKGLAQRWLIAYFPASRQTPNGCVQLLEWQTDATGSTINGVNGQLPQPIEANEEDLPVKLGERPLEINMLPMGSSVLVKLVFNHGEVTVTADTKRGIRAVDWIKANNGLRYAERYSWGDMDTAVWIRRPNSQGHWADDQILDKTGKPLGISDAIGHINGADGLQNDPGKVFLASGNSCVYGIDLLSPQTPMSQWKIPTGAVQDVLVVQINEPSADLEKNQPQLLAAAEDGTVYLLATDDSRQIRWQYTKRHIHRIIGNGSSQILALDQRGTLFPLSLGNLGDYYRIKNAATEVLLKHTPPVPRPFQPDSDYAGEMRRGLEHLFWLLKEQKNLPKPSVLASIPDWYDDLVTSQLAASLHEKLLGRFFSWLSNQCFPKKDNRVGIASEYLETFWPLLDLPDHAPHSLWLLLLQEQDWLDLYASERGNSLTNGLRDWRNRLEKKRHQLTNAFHFALHPLASGRFKESIRHLRTLDINKNLLVMVSTANDIRVVRDGTKEGVPWQELQLIMPEPKTRGCVGVITTLCVLPPEANKPQRHAYQVIVGSNRGELRWWGLDVIGGKVHLTLLQQAELPLSLLCSHYLPDRHGLLLSGRNNLGKGALYWFNFAKSADRRQIWDTEEAGCLRMMAFAEDGQRLWALNRWPGQLLHFPDIQRFFERHKKVEYQIWLKARRALHALEFAGLSNTVVCGGDEGLTLAYCGNTGRLKWAVHCGSNVRRIRHLPNDNEKESGLWVLSGDSNESLLLRGDCCVQGVLAHDSPVSTLRSEDGTNQLLLGTINGQVLRFASHTIQHAQTIEAPKRDILLQKLNSWASEHCLETQLWLIYAAESLLSLPGDKELAQAIGAYLRLGAVAGDAVFFHRLLSGGIGKHDPEESGRLEIIELCRLVWQTYLNGSPIKQQGAVCKALSGIMAVLESLAEIKGTQELSEPLRQSALALLQEISNHIWANNPEGPTDLSFGEETLQAVQLSQLLRQWDTTEKFGDTATRLHHWCKRLAQHWGLMDWDDFRIRLHQGFASGLVLTGHKQDAWEIWFQDLLADGPYNKTAPTPLSTLEQPCKQPLEPSQIENLSLLFPDNAAWHSWLTNLQHALGLVREETINASGIAWQQQATWLALREHWQGQGNDYFTLSHGQGLLALWWPHLCGTWLEYIDLQLTAFRIDVKAHAQDYLLLTWVDRWHSANDVELELQLRNHYLGPLKLVKAEWNNQAQELGELQLPADKSAHRLILVLRCTVPELLQGCLTLHYIHTETGDELICNTEIKVGRSLERFAPGVQWQATWQRLLVLLQGTQAFLWVDGAHWSLSEKQHLKQMVLDKYALDLNQTNGHCRLLPSLDDALADEYATWPVFSPDLALGIDDNSLLESVHELLCPVAGKFSLLALAVWLAFRPPPEAVEQALANLLPTSAATKNLLTRLLAGDSGRTERFAQTLRNLSPQALGAWCRGEPVYHENNGQNQELYFPSACAMTHSIWDCLDNAAVPIGQIAELLNQDYALAERQHQQREMLRHCWDTIEQLDSPAIKAEALAKILLSRLTPEKLQKAKPVGWFVEDTRIPPRIQLRFQEFNRCYVLPRSSAQTKAKFKEYAPALWLCLGEDQAPKELPGLALALSLDDCLALLHLETIDDNNGPVLRLLNRIAYRQLPLAPENLWRTAGGLGEQVGKHFAGRECELAQIRASLAAADQEKAAAVLIIGSRRVGKTSLRQRIRFEIEKQTPDRLIVELDFQGMPPELRGIELEYYFFLRWAEQLAKAGMPLSREEVWPNAYKDSVEWRNKARSVLTTRLNAIRRRTGYAPLLSLDETDHLAYADHADPKHSYALFEFLRKLSTSGVCLLATSYPHGRGRNYALNVASHNASSPFYNTFKMLTLGGLEPDEAWKYLRGKLAGLGIILPEYYRQPMLCLSRGIPWIVQALGKALYQQAQDGNVVRADHWSFARSQVMQELGGMLRTTVESVAQSNDAKFGLSLLQAPERCLSNSRLWAALLKLIRLRKHGIKPAEHWPDDLRFDLIELREYLPQVALEHLRNTLNDLAPSPVVDGVLDGEPDQFEFTSNLLPAWVSQQGEQA